MNSLSEEMKCCILTTPEGDVLIVHEDEIASAVQWIEYAPKTKTFNLIHEDGTSQELGIDFDETSMRNLKKGQNVLLAHTQGKEIVSVIRVNLVIQDY